MERQPITQEDSSIVGIQRMLGNMHFLDSVSSFAVVGNKDPEEGLSPVQFDPDEDFLTRLAHPPFLL